MMIKKVLILFSLILTFTSSFAQFNETKVQELQTVLNSIVTSVDNSGVSISVKVLHADQGKELYSFKPELKLIPASITKLITAACAFDRLGTGYAIRTVIYTDDIDINDSQVNGNLYIKGYGDPDLNSSDVYNLANQVLSRNIKVITGNIIGDESFFDENYKTLSGSYSGDTGPTYWPYVNALTYNKNKGYRNPGLNCAEDLSMALVASGVQFQGSVVYGSTPQVAKEVAQISHSLYDVLAYMNKESDNHSAITIFKLLGAKLVSEPGTLEKGQLAISKFLSEIGIARYSYEILEGSGLSRYNQVNAELFIKLLKYMYDDQLLFDYFMNSMSISGKEGTLRNRMIGTEAEGNIYGKTGTLNGVSALSGYAIDRDNEILIFYIVMNGFGGRANQMRSVQDDICIQLAQFSRK